MLEKTAEFFVQAAEGTEVECCIRRDYSGRGMYGRKTFGIVTDCPMKLMTMAISYCLELEISGDHEFGDDSNEVINDLYDGFKTDSIGLDTIVY